MISNTIEIDHISPISPFRTCSTTAWTTSDRIDAYKPRFNDYRITPFPLSSPFLSTIASESGNSSSNSTDFARSLESMTTQSANPPHSIPTSNASLDSSSFPIPTANDRSESRFTSFCTDVKSVRRRFIHSPSIPKK